MTDHQPERRRRARQFRLLLEQMHPRSRPEVHGDCFLVFNEKPSSGGSKNRLDESRRVALPQAVKAHLESGVTGGTSAEDPPVDDLPDEGWRQDDGIPRFLPP